MMRYRNVQKEYLYHKYAKLGQIITSSVKEQNDGYFDRKIWKLLTRKRSATLSSFRQFSSSNVC
jgi:hypothetical protein